MELTITDNTADKSIVYWALLSTIFYLVLMMESFGSILLDLVFEQFTTEMINQPKVARVQELRLQKEQIKRRLKLK